MRRGLCPSTTSIDFIDSNKTSSVEIYEKLARYCDEQTSKSSAGADLPTSDAGSGKLWQSKHPIRRFVKTTTAADANALETRCGGI